MSNYLLRCVKLTCILVSICVGATSAKWHGSSPDYNFIGNVVKQCSENDAMLSCLAGRAAKAVDRAINWDVPLYDGLVLKRNQENVENVTQSRSSTGMAQFSFALSRFLDTHTLTLDLSEARDGSAGSGGGYGIFGVDKKNRKYLYYALTAVLGIFGLSGPMILKGLALIAGKALLASKAALIIIGSVALKKIFQSDESSSPVKVHTHTVPIDEHDRFYNTGGYQYVNNY